MARRIAIIQGHPDAKGGHFGHALADAYAAGASAAGHEIKSIDVAQLEFPLLRTKEDWKKGTPPDAIRLAQETICRADHLLILYPLWLGAMPAILKAFLEQVMRPGFAFSHAGSDASWKKLLKGKSARIVVTMGMPALVYRWFFRAHSLKSLERNILKFVGIGPVSETLIGSVETCGKPKRETWLERLHALGRTGR